MFPFKETNVVYFSAGSYQQSAVSRQRSAISFAETLRLTLR
jgi:hypothetical protein